MSVLFRDMTYALRTFRSTRVFAVTAVLTLALGIGGTTAIFTLMHAVMLKSLPVADPSRLYRIGDGDNCCVQGGPQDRWGMFSFPLFERLKAEATEFESLTAFQAGMNRMAVRRQGVDVAPRPLRAIYVTGNYFTTLGVGPFAGRVFTAEDLRAAVNTRIMAEGAVPAHTICAPGDQAVDPHEEGRGPIRAHAPVVMDIFPRSEATGYFGDLTRTVVRGKASFALHELYAIVHEGVRLGHGMLRAGVEGMKIHKAIQDLFERQGYKTGVKDGRMQGFFHGTGHGLGLQIHEAPSIGKRPCVMRAGHVVTVEPGLYYLGLGGVRIEDVALVTRTGSRCLTKVPKQLEI